MNALVTEPTDQLRRIAALAGLESDLLGQPGVRRWIDRRASALGLSASSYQDRLVAMESERRLLSEQVAVPESWINRYPASFELLRDRGLASCSGKGTFRVASLGCAGGQEPFTVAAVLADAGVPRDRIEIIAVDRSRSAIDVARSGLLPSMAVRDELPSTWRARFKPEGTSWRVDPEIHAMVRFVEADILTDPLSIATGSCDVVLCRNVLIYLDVEARRRLCLRAAALLKTGGVLFAGHADPPADLGQALDAMDVPGGFAWRTVSEKESVRPSLDTRARSHRPSVASGGSRAVPRTERPPARSVIPDAASVRRLADAGRIDEARVAGEALLERSPDDLRIRFLLALIEREDGRLDVAREHLRRLLYLSPDHVKALLMMVSIAEAEGDLPAAARHRRRLDRIDVDPGETSS